MALCCPCLLIVNILIQSLHILCIWYLMFHYSAELYFVRKSFCCQQMIALKVFHTSSTPLLTRSPRQQKLSVTLYKSFRHWKALSGGNVTVWLKSLFPNHKWYLEQVYFIKVLGKSKTYERILLMENVHMYILYLFVCICYSSLILISCDYCKCVSLLYTCCPLCPVFCKNMSGHWEVLFYLETGESWEYKRHLAM